MLPAFRIIVGVTGAQCDADLRLEEIDSLEEVRDALDDGVSKSELVLDLRTRTPRPVTVVHVIDEARDLLRSQSETTIRCLVATEEIATLLREHFRRDQGKASRWRIAMREVELHLGDITSIRADAVVNASNTMLKLGSGVSGALGRACDAALQADMSSRAPIEPGGLAATPAHGLPGVRAILHVATARGSSDIVRRAFENCLTYCDRRALGILAVPGLGMGSGGLAADTVNRVFRQAIAEHAGALPALVRVVLWTESDYQVFEADFAADLRFSPLER